MNLFFKLNPYVEKQQKNLITYDMQVGSSPVLDIFILRWKRPFWWQIYVFRLKGARNIEQRDMVFMQCTLRHPNSWNTQREKVW